MIGKLLTTTGLLLVLSTAANAQAAGGGASPADGTNGAPAATSSTTAAANAGGGAVNVSGLHPSDMAAIKVDDLKGVDVLNPSGEKIASINDIVLQQDGKVDAVIVDFGGFLGIGTKQIALGYDGLQFMDDGNGKHYLVVNTTKDQLNAQPAYNKDDYASNRDNERLTAAAGTSSTPAAADTSAAPAAAANSSAAPAATSSTPAAAANPSAAPAANPPAAATAASSSAAPAANPSTASPAASSSAMAPAASGSAAMAAPVTDPAQFAMMAGTSNMFEIQSSQLALTKAQSPDVKSFAQKMIDDHTKAGQDMETAAKAQNVTPPAKLDAANQAKLDQLNGLSGQGFDSAYDAMQLKAHQDAVALFQGYGSNGPAGALKDFAAKTLPTLQMHLQMAEKLPK